VHQLGRDAAWGGGAGVRSAKCDANGVEEDDRGFVDRAKTGCSK